MSAAIAPRARFELEAVGTAERRVIEAADTCVSRWGWAKTTVSDIGEEAGMSRASVYRTFPGGRDAIYEALQRHRELGFFHDLHQALSAGDDLESVLTDTIVTAARNLAADDHFQYQLEHEPGPILRQLTFEGLDRLMAVARVFVAPHLARFVTRRQAARLAEWTTRIVVSHTLQPSSYLDLTDEISVRDFVATRAIHCLETREATPSPNPDQEAK